MTSAVWVFEALLVTYVTLSDVVTAQTWSSSSEISVVGCPHGISVPTELGRSWARVSWIIPRFADRDGVEVTPTKVTHNPGERFPVGIHDVRYAKVDGTHTVTCSFVVRVDDEEPPKITNCPSDITIPADSGSTSRSSVTWDVPKATDNFLLKSFESSSSLGSSFPMGYTPVSYKAMDLNGNQAECTFNVVVTDDEKPLLEGCPVEALSYVLPTETSGAVSWTEPRGVDNSGPPRIISTHARGEVFPLGRTEVVYTATDAAGNVATCSFQAIVKVEIPGDKIFLNNYSSTELEITWPQHVNKKASSYLIYTWPVGSDQPLASDHLYHPINRRESFTTRTLRGLSPGVEYKIQIYVTGVGDTLKTKLRTRPSIPTSFSYEEDTLDSTSVVLIWKPGGGYFDQYQISYQAAWRETVTELRPLDKGVVKYYVTDLDPDTSLVFSLVAVSGVGESKTISNARNLTLTTAPLPQSRILLQKVTASSVQILVRLLKTTSSPTPSSVEHRHQPQPGNLYRPLLYEDDDDTRHHSDGHIVVLFSNKSDVFTDVIFDDGTLQYEFTLLEPTTTYTIRIIPSDGSGLVLEEIVTTRPATVQDIVLVEVTNSSVTVSWTLLSGQYNRYKVTLTPGKTPSDTPMIVDKNEVTINGLVPLTTYVVSVVTMYGSSESAPADIEVTPGVDKPNAILKLADQSCLSPIVASCILSVCLFFIGLYICRLRMCNKYGAPHTRRTEENDYESPTRPNSGYLRSPSYQNTEGAGTIAMLLRHSPPISVTGYMYPPNIKGSFGKGRRYSSGSKDSDGILTPIYDNVKEEDS
ncbi:tenascin-R-like [Asterias amurensis]|uniref:tenascin-R-like n=1 Tax=Asterias amurensis TaxID=7602 RepID=UPI003AB2B948